MPRPATKADYIAGELARDPVLITDKAPRDVTPPEAARIRACPACARAVRARETPDVLRDGATPYYEADPARSVWATTGYGQFRGTWYSGCSAVTFTVREGTWGPVRPS